MLDSLSSSQVAALMKSGLVRTISRRIISDLSLVSQSSSHLQTLSPGQTDTLISHNRNKQRLLPFLLPDWWVTCATDDHVLLSAAGHGPLVIGVLTPEHDA